MYNLLLKLMISAALLEFGINYGQFICNTDACTHRIENASRDVLKINWKPITIFPEEAKKFR